MKALYGNIPKCLRHYLCRGVKFRTRPTPESWPCVKECQKSGSEFCPPPHNFSRWKMPLVAPNRRKPATFGVPVVKGTIFPNASGNWRTARVMGHVIVVGQLGWPMLQAVVKQAKNRLQIPACIIGLKCQADARVFKIFRCQVEGFGELFPTLRSRKWWLPGTPVQVCCLQSNLGDGMMPEIDALWAEEIVNICLS